jgi:hypothetical protein
VGIFVGWIVQKRWFTIAAVFLLVVGLVAIPHLPPPINALWVLLPAALLTAAIYEWTAFVGPGLGPRTRLAGALCMGLGAMVFAAGIVFWKSNPAVFWAGGAAFLLLEMIGLIWMAATNRNYVLRERLRSADVPDSATSSPRPRIRS